MSLGGVNPLAYPDFWDVVDVGGVISPGLCKVGKASREQEFDVKKGKGTVAATLTFVQKPPAKFQIVFKVWLESQWDEWEAFLPLFKYDPTKKAVQAIDIYHPSLADIDIHSVVADDIGSWEFQDDKSALRTISFIEYNAPNPKNAVSTPDGSKSGFSSGERNGSNQQPSADEEYQRQIAELTKKAQEP